MLLGDWNCMKVGKKSLKALILYIYRLKWHLLFEVMSQGVLQKH